MGYKHTEVVMSIDLKRLSDPFPETEIEWRVQHYMSASQSAVIVPYITARAVQDRLDAVCGQSEWKNEYRHESSGHDVAVYCGISIRLDGEWVTKWDASEQTEIEPVKGGASVAERRAGVQWGIGRYLYSIPREFMFVKCITEYANGYERSTFKNETFYFKPKKLPAMFGGSDVVEKHEKPVETKTVNIDDRLNICKKIPNLVQNINTLALITYLDNETEKIKTAIIDRLSAWNTQPAEKRASRPGLVYIAETFALYPCIGDVKSPTMGVIGSEAIKNACMDEGADINALLENLRGKLQAAKEGKK